jgi:hypothetical protein
MAALPSNHEEIIKEIDSLSLPNNNFNPYMSAPQKFQEDHESLKAEMYLAIERSQIKIMSVALAIIFASVLLFR